jgi:ABC-type amino acid transport substrate-binding protein
MLRSNIATLLACLAFSLAAAAQNTLKIGVADSDGPPIAVVSNNVLVSGITKEIGTLLAHELDVKPTFIVISRKRVESAIETGHIDIICNANPDWYDDAGQLQWTREIFPQIEKIATLDTVGDINRQNELSGMRIATIHGYSYPTMEQMWSSGQASQTTEENLSLMMKAVSGRLADAAIVSELEFAAWARSNPQAAPRLKLHPLIVTSVPTMCALSPASNFKLANLDRAIDHLHQTGAFKALLHRYQWHPD